MGGGGEPCGGDGGEHGGSRKGACAGQSENSQVPVASPSHCSFCSGSQVTVKIFDKKTSEKVVEAEDVTSWVYNESLVKSNKNNEVANAYKKAKKMALARELEEAAEYEDGD